MSDQFQQQPGMQEKVDSGQTLDKILSAQRSNSCPTPAARERIREELEAEHKYQAISSIDQMLTK